ncbi:MAG: type I restriction-modification system subunit M [Lactobacillaceae bacterium]|jgi:type I restriction enzyme M protein|nr:type I restriction-modification system subunit M [Lactobacillaceae bacterium]
MRYVPYNEEQMNISAQVSHIWSIANTLRGGGISADDYKKVIVPFTIITRLEAALAETKDKVVKLYENNDETPSAILSNASGYNFYNTSRFTLKNLLDDPDNIQVNFEDYLNGFSTTIKELIKRLDFHSWVIKLGEKGRLYGIVKKFSELDLDPKTVDNQKMGYMFEDIIRRFSENANAGDHYTPREVIALMVNLLIADAPDDLFEDGKVITMLDMAAGTGGMLSTGERYLKTLNPNLDVRLFGQEIDDWSYGIALADMLIRGESPDNFVLQDTLVKDAFEDQKMNFVIANPPFGESWGGRDAGDGVEDAVNADKAKFEETNGRAGRFVDTPTTGDMQMLFHQHGIAKLNEHGRAAIISNGSPLFSGGTTSGESQIRRYWLENDLLEAIIALPGQLFYNTGISIYVWLYNKNKPANRRGKVQFVDASEQFTNLRKSLGNKRRELSPDNIENIVNDYHNFTENKRVKIFDAQEFLYKEYSVYQPLQRSGKVNDATIENLKDSSWYANLFDEVKYQELLETEPRTNKQDKEMAKMVDKKTMRDLVIEKLRTVNSGERYDDYGTFVDFIKQTLNGVTVNTAKLTPANVETIAQTMSEMDKTAIVQKTEKAKASDIWDAETKFLYDKSTKDTEIVKLSENVDDYFAREVYPHVPDAKYFDDGKTGAEIPFTRYFYEYQAPKDADVLLSEFNALENELQKLLGEL